jgi:hypothetical protein
MVIIAGRTARAARQCPSRPRREPHEVPAALRRRNQRDGELLVADGPFAETKEQIAGFNIIECADLQEAIEVASAHPTTRHGTIEIRPFPPE